MKFLKQKKGADGGYIVMTVVIFFIIISLTIIFGVITPMLTQAKNASQSFTSRESYFLAEAGIEDAVYKFKTGRKIDSSIISLNGENITVAVEDIDGGKKVTASGNKSGTLRKVEARMVGDAGVLFTNAIFTGNGGFNITGGSTVYGAVYSNGDIVGSGGSRIANNGLNLGDAVSATIISSSTNQTSGTAFPPTQEIRFGGRLDSNNIYPQDMAQTFQVSTSDPLTAVRVYIKKSSGTGVNDITLRIADDNFGNPGKTTTSVNLPNTQISTSFGYIAVTLTIPPLTPGSTYWIVLDTTYQSENDYYTVGASVNSYAGGIAKTGTYTNTIDNIFSDTSPPGLDAYFDVVVGSDTGVISGLSIDNDAWAYDISNATITGIPYCQIGSGNNQACNTSRADPSPISFPISDQNISTWKGGITEEISPIISGGWTYTGNLTIGNTGTTTSTLKKVVGNLTLSCNSATPANFGDVWVTGNIVVQGGCIFNANQVKVDGNVNISSDSGNIGALEVTGNISISTGGTLTAGPIKVSGDITVGSTALILKGSLWVVGNLTLQSGGVVRLHSSYDTQSGVIIADGRLDISSGGTFAGSGQTGSFPLFITLSTCPTGEGCSSQDAVQMNGGAGAVIIVAQNGTISMSGGTAAKALIGNQVNLSGGASVTYDSTLSSLSFASGQSGSYDIQLWKEVE